MEKNDIFIILFLQFHYFVYTMIKLIKLLSVKDGTPMVANKSIKEHLRGRGYVC